MAFILTFLLALGAAPLRASAAPTVSREQVAADIQQMQQAVAVCQTISSACGKQQTPTESALPAPKGSPSIRVNWEWLSAALDTAGKAKPVYRDEILKAASARLAEMQKQLIATNSLDDFPKANVAAKQVLSRAEFQEDVGPSWFSRQMAKIGALFVLLFAGAGALGKTAPWLGPTIEVLLYFGAAVGIFYFVRRAFARQRMAIALGSGAVRAAGWDKDAENWAGLADSCAANEQWRDAVHCLYWAAIVRLEAASAWRHNPTRTPREYVRLLKPGSSQQTSLRSLTQVFERVWYGIREASDADYQQARLLFESLSRTTPRQNSAVVA